MTIKYIFGDIHEKIKDLKDNTINLIYTSPPYGITKAKWDAMKDIWMVIVLDDGLVHFNLEGQLVRLCFKWIHRTGDRRWQNTSLLELIPGCKVPSPIPTGTRTSGSTKETT